MIITKCIWNVESANGRSRLVEDEYTVMVNGAPPKERGMLALRCD